MLKPQLRYFTSGFCVCSRPVARLPGLPFPPKGSLRELQDSQVMFPGKVPKPGFQVRFPSSKVSKRGSL